MRFFNKSGPVKCEDHYCLDPLGRLDLEKILLLIEQKKYFIMHAPRQTGKTSCLLAFMKYLNQEGNFRCLYINVEKAQTAREDVGRGMRSILGEIVTASRNYLADHFLAGCWIDILEKWGQDNALNEALTRWSEHSDKPVVLLIDEIDSLIGDTLISVLRQLRAGYHNRPDQFPQTVILCGVRDIRDYRMHDDKMKEVITGGSAFNIKDESLRLGDFTREDIQKLYQCHTDETGQEFAPDVLDLVWELTEGQPWLVNALADEACFNIKENRNRLKIITADMIIQAKENIILRRETHIDQLVDKLKEERVQRVIEPMLTGKTVAISFKSDDVSYVVDLGLIKQSRNGEIRLANRIYQEVIPRELGWDIQSGMSIKSTWFINKDGMLDMEKLMLSFQDFFRMHSDHWLEIYQYKEAGPQLLLQAYLQRIVNSGGRVEREYGLGRKRVDIFIVWNHPQGIQKVVIELKILYGSLDSTIKEGLEQTACYMDICGTNEGHLVIFDRVPNKKWEEKIFQKQEYANGKTIKIWGM